MDFRLFNYVRGITDLLGGWRRPFDEAARETAALARRRARECGITPEQAQNLSHHEHMVGQTGFVVLALSVTASLVVLAANHTAPEWVLCLLALVPGATLLSSVWIERRMRTRWGI